MPSDGPTFEVVGDLSDEAIEALAALLLSIAEHDDLVADQQVVRCPEDASIVERSA